MVKRTQITISRKTKGRKRKLTENRGNKKKCEKATSEDHESPIVIFV